MNKRIDKRDYYNAHPSGVECIDIAKHHNFNIGNVIKYCWRAGLKKEQGLSDHQKQLDDLNKAQYYLSEEISMLNGDEGGTEGLEPCRGEYLNVGDVFITSKVGKEKFVVSGNSSQGVCGMSESYSIIVPFHDTIYRLKRQISQTNNVDSELEPMEYTVKKNKYFNFEFKYDSTNQIPVSSTPTLKFYYLRGKYLFLIGHYGDYARFINIETGEADLYDYTWMVYPLEGNYTINKEIFKKDLLSNIIPFGKERIVSKNVKGKELVIGDFIYVYNRIFRVSEVSKKRIQVHDSITNTYYILDEGKEVVLLKLNGQSKEEIISTNYTDILKELPVEVCGKLATYKFKPTSQLVSSKYLNGGDFLYADCLDTPNFYEVLYSDDISLVVKDIAVDEKTIYLPHLKVYKVNCYSIEYKSDSELEQLGIYKIESPYVSAAFYKGSLSEASKVEVGSFVYYKGTIFQRVRNDERSIAFINLYTNRLDKLSSNTEVYQLTPIYGVFKDIRDRISGYKETSLKNIQVGDYIKVGDSITGRVCLTLDDSIKIHTLGYPMTIYQIKGQQVTKLILS